MPLYTTELRPYDIPAMRPLRLALGDSVVLLVREGATVAAFDEICPHKALSMQHGVVLGGKLICPWHQYAFDLESGVGPRRCPPATVYPTTVNDAGYIVVDLPEGVVSSSQQ